LSSGISVTGGISLDSFFERISKAGVVLVGTSCFTGITGGGL